MRMPFFAKMALTMSLLSLSVTGICTYYFYSHFKETLLVAVGTELLSLGQTGRHVFGEKEKQHINRLKQKLISKALNSTTNLPPNSLLSKSHIKQLAKNKDYLELADRAAKDSDNYTLMFLNLRRGSDSEVIFNAYSDGFGLTRTII